jgi:hypothetical protein
MSKSTRERIKAKKRRARLRNVAIGAVIVFVVAAGLTYLANQSRERESGAAIPIPQVQLVEEMEEVSHVAEGTDPGPYNTDPPTSGKHYATQAFAGFNDESDLESFGDYPPGYLVHSLEHGYVIFWYNCDAFGGADCEDLKDDIQRVMGRVGDFKVIAFPWSSIEVPVVMTSWGRMLSFEQFDADIAEQYVRNFRNQAPEPNAP